jgi:hypothetical protein
MIKGSFRSSRTSIEISPRRCIELLLGLVRTVALIFVVVPAGGEDWWVGAANRQIAPSAVFSPVSTLAGSIATLAWFILAVTGAIFLIVASLLLYSVVRFRARHTDEPCEPANYMEASYRVCLDCYSGAYRLRSGVNHHSYDLRCAGCAGASRRYPYSSNRASMVVGVSVPRSRHSYRE